jgi:DNA ligase 1
MVVATRPATQPHKPTTPMRDFASLYEALDASTGTADKLAALVAYFQNERHADAAWAAYVLAGGKPRQAVPTAVLRAAACHAAGLEEWLFEECYQAAGDLAETIAHVLPLARGTSSEGLAHWIEQRILPLRGLPAAEQQARLLQAFDELDALGRFLFVKLIGGGFRVGVSRLLVQRALAEVAGLPAQLVAERLVGFTDAKRAPTAADFAAGAASRIRSFSPTRSKASRRRRSARCPTGSRSGSTTASGRRSCAGVGNAGSGRAARS